MKVIGKDRTSCDVCNPIDEILARLDALERRASAIVAKVQGIAPDGEGNVTLPTSSSDTDPLHGRVDAFAMSSEVKEAADDAHAYAASIANDVVVINSEIDALNQAVAALQPAEIEAIKSAVQTLQTTVATLESTVSALNNSVAGKVSKAGDTMTGTLSINNGNSIIRKTTLESNNSATTVTEVGRIQIRSASNETANLISVSSPANNSTYLRATRKVGKSNVDADIIVNVGASGDKYATAPTPPNKADNSTKIATTAWVNTATSVVHTTGNETISGIKTFNTSPVVPSTSSDATGTEIATANWVIAKINEVATKNGLSGL